MTDSDLGITLEDRNIILKSLDTQEGDLFKRYKRDPLTLKLQSQIARNVGFGNVNLEFKRITKAKRKLRIKGVSEIKSIKKKLLARPIIEPEVIELPEFELDTNLDF